MNTWIQRYLPSAKRLMGLPSSSEGSNTNNTLNTQQQHNEVTMNNYTTDAIRDMDQTEFDLIAFPLSGKVAGRISSLAMSLAGTQVRRATHLDESDQPSIDKFNDMLAELDQIESQNKFFELTGLETPINKEQQLRAWLGVRQVLVERGFTPSPLAENFKYIIEQTIKRNNPSAEEIELLAQSSDLTVEAITATYKAKAKRAVDDSIEVATHAMRLLNDYEPDEMTTPDGFDAIVKSAIEQSQKSAIVRANNTEEALANLMVLKAMSAGNYS